jgi:hypothetical protein
MNIFFWFLILAFITLVINGAWIFSMHRHGKYRCRPVILVLLAGYLAAALLYILAQENGTHIQSRTLACSMPIGSISTEETDDLRSYTLSSTDGISFQFDESELLDTQVPEDPSTLEVYFCRTCTGFSWCYLSQGTAIRYILK